MNKERYVKSNFQINENFIFQFIYILRWVRAYFPIEAPPKSQYRESI